MPYQIVGDGGQPLDAHLDLEQSDIIFQSRGGILNTPSMRNSAYGPALRLVLERLSVAGVSLTGAWVETSTTKSMTAEERTILTPSQLALPAAEQFSLMSERMRLVGRATDARYGGSTTKRIRIATGHPGPGLVDLIGARWRHSLGGTKPPAVAAPLPLEFLNPVEAVDSAMVGWLAALVAEARPTTPKRFWLPDGAIMFASKISSQRPGAIDVELGVRASGEPWTVQLNAPRRAGDANGLTSVATNEAGRLILIRQGRLRLNPDSSGEIVGAQFQILSGLVPVAVADASTPQTREWYVVAVLDEGGDAIRAQTAAFVHACARARAASLGVVTPDGDAFQLAGDEKGGSFFKKPTDAKPEQEVRRIQGEVWLSLRRKLEGAGVVMTKPRHIAGYEVDGVIITPARKILLEIKTGTSASDVYEGLGQLMLYRKLLRLTGYTQVLLLPEHAPPALIKATKECGVEVHHYQDRSTSSDIDIQFTDSLLALCGAGPSKN